MVRDNTWYTLSSVARLGCLPPNWASCEQEQGKFDIGLLFWNFFFYVCFVVCLFF